MLVLWFSKQSDSAMDAIQLGFSDMRLDEQHHQQMAVSAPMTPPHLYVKTTSY